MKSTKRVLFYIVILSLFSLNVYVLFYNDTYNIKGINRSNYSKTEKVQKYLMKFEYERQRTYQMASSDNRFIETVEDFYADSDIYISKNLKEIMSLNLPGLMKKKIKYKDIEDNHCQYYIPNFLNTFSIIAYNPYELAEKVHINEEEPYPVFILLTKPMKSKEDILVYLKNESIFFTPVSFCK
ncbi:MAG: hypothetical protein ACOC2U_05485 [bacterium]